MQTFFLRLSFLLFFAWSWFLTAPQAFAGITSFTASPSNINNGQITGFVWSTTGNSGAKLNLSCLRGIQYFYDRGSPIPRGTYLRPCNQWRRERPDNKYEHNCFDD